MMQQVRPGQTHPPHSVGFPDRPLKRQRAAGGHDRRGILRAQFYRRSSNLGFETFGFETCTRLSAGPHCKYKIDKIRDSAGGVVVAACINLEHGTRW